MKELCSRTGKASQFGCMVGLNKNIPTPSKGGLKASYHAIAHLPTPCLPLGPRRAALRVQMEPFPDLFLAADTATAELWPRQSSGTQSHDPRHLLRPNDPLPQSQLRPQSLAALAGPARHGTTAPSRGWVLQNQSRLYPQAQAQQTESRHGQRERQQQRPLDTRLAGVGDQRALAYLPHSRSLCLDPQQEGSALSKAQSGLDPVAETGPHSRLGQAGHRLGRRGFCLEGQLQSLAAMELGLRRPSPAFLETGRWA